MNKKKKEEATDMTKERFFGLLGKLFTLANFLARLWPIK